MKLKFCANISLMYTKEATSLLDRYALAKSFGFKAVECAFPYDFTKEEILAAKGDQMEQILINTDPGSCLGFAALVGKEDEFLSSLKKSLEYCQTLECRKLHIMSGKVSEGQAGSIQVLRSNLTQALPLLESAGVVGLIEPINPHWVPGYFLSDFDMAANLVKEINHPHLKLQLDIFHLQYLKGNITNNIAKFASMAGHVQIAQVPTRHEPNSPGENNYQFVLDVLEKSDYNDGWVGLEYIPKNGTNEGLSWIQDMGYTL